MGADFLIFLWRRLRPVEGWLIWTLLVIAVLMLPWAVAAAGWLPGSGALFPISFVALLLGLRMGRGRWAGAWLAVAAIIGAIVIGLWLGGVFPSLGQTWTAARQTVAWFATNRAGEWPGLPVLRVSEAAAVGFAQRLAAWSGTLRGGPPTNDTLPVLWLAAAVTWWATLWAGFAMRRWRQVGWALLPVGALLANHVVFAPGVSAPLVLFLVATLALLAQGRLLALEERWEAERVDYSGEIRIDLTFATAAVVLLLPILAWAAPLPILYGPARAAWQAFEGPRQAAGEIAKRAMGPLQRPPTGGLFGRPADFSDLPYSRILSEPPNLRDQVVLRVQTNDPPPYGPNETYVQRYLRLETFDTYTGRGWENTALTERRVEAENTDAAYASLPGGTRLLQSYTLADGAPSVAANNPVAIDRPYTRLERGPAELVGLRIDARQYTVVSRLTTASVGQLRSAAPLGDDRFTALPPTVPARVRDLARSLTQDAPTDYDKADRLEKYVRSFPYNLDVPGPPPGREIADYFLFDLKQGYCDYMASTMVVLLRVVGIPARLATGYVTGSYDRDTNQWVVTGHEAHAWPEVYFSGIGWVEFEPTSGRADIERPPEDAPLPPVITSTPPEPERRWGWLLALPLAAALLGGVWLGVSVYRRRRFEALPPAQQVRELWTRLVGRAARFGHAPAPTQTPLEYARDLAGDLEQREVDLGPWEWRGREGRRPLDRLAEQYTSVTYSEREPAPGAAVDAQSAWERVKGLLWLLAWRSLPDNRQN